MNIKPILFSTPMVQAILAGRKTQTRRICKPLTMNYPQRAYPNEPPEQWLVRWNHKAKYQIGDILWVRETWMLETEQGIHTGAYIYKATDRPEPDDDCVLKWRPSIFMPKAAARIFLRVTDVRAERLQGITLEDIEREGLYCDPPYTKDHWAYGGGMIKHWVLLWNDINAKRGYPWESNPWVWVYTFERCEMAEGWPA